MGEFRYKKQCPRCAEKGNDNSKNNLAVYADNSAFCFACNYTVGSKNNNNLDNEGEEYIPKMSKEKITKDEYESIIKNTSTNGRNYRHIKDETYAVYGVRHEFDPTTRQVVRQFYPATEDYKLTGFKTRIHPKDFTKPVGKCGKENELFGQAKFKDSTCKYVCIAAGEIDAMSAYQMLRENQLAKGNGDYSPIPCVSSTVGEGTAAAQCQQEYAWLDRFDRIYVIPDNDGPGEEALQKMLKIFPKGKVWVVRLGLKDTNKYLEEGRQKEWCNLFYGAKRHIAEGVTSSLDLEDKMREYVSMPRISLPPFMHKAQKMLCGGIPFKAIVNILAASGIGKSTYVDAMIIHWIMNTDFKVGILSLEASDGEYGVNLSSSYCGFKLNLLETPEERLAYLAIPENYEKRQKLWKKEDGEARFYLLDADIDVLKAKVEYLIRSLGCKIIVLDPLQDIFDAMPEDAQAGFMKWQKDTMKSEGITFININHSRKSSKGQKANSTGADLHEEDMHGHSSIFKSGLINIILSRDKEAEDPIERNTTYAKITKARGIGNTGPCGEYYYENETHTLHDKEDYFNKRTGL